MSEAVKSTENNNQENLNSESEELKSQASSDAENVVEKDEAEINQEEITSELSDVEENVADIQAEQEDVYVEEAVNEPELDYKLVIEDLNDKVLRAAAELQNVKRRAEQDIKKSRDYSIESFARDMLAVMDNLHRAADSISQEEAEKDEKLKAIRDGVEITRKEMVNVFERNNIKCVDPIGEKFDHNFHQAMSQVEDADKESGTVVNVMQTGYVIKDRLIRPALVIVVK